MPLAMNIYSINIYSKETVKGGSPSPSLSALMYFV